MRHRRRSGRRCFTRHVSNYPSFAMGMAAKKRKERKRRGLNRQPHAAGTHPLGERSFRFRILSLRSLRSFVSSDFVHADGVTSCFCTRTVRPGCCFCRLRRDSPWRRGSLPCSAARHRRISWISSVVSGVVIGVFIFRPPEVGMVWRGSACANPGCRECGEGVPVCLGSQCGGSSR